MSRAAPYHRSDFPVFREMQTRWDDNDVYGHLNNAVHYRLFDSLLTGWLIERDLLDPVKSDVISLVVSTGCTYFSELAFPQSISAGLRVERIGRTSITYAFGLYGQGDQAAAQGHLTHVLAHRSTHEPCPIPQAWLAALETIRPTDPQRGPDQEFNLTQQTEIKP